MTNNCGDKTTVSKASPAWAVLLDTLMSWAGTFTWPSSFKLEQSEQPYTSSMKYNWKSSLLFTHLYMS